MGLDLIAIDSSTESAGAPRGGFCGTLRATTCTTLELARQLARNENQPLVVAYSVQSMVEGILEQLRLTTDPTVLIGVLRIIGHGAPGSQAMGDSNMTSHPRQLIALDRSGHLMNRAILVRLRGYFDSASWVELHGCNVGNGRQGIALLTALNSLWGIPVSAGINTQFARTLGLDGPKITIGAGNRRT
jgi:hypothetical protein